MAHIASCLSPNKSPDLDMHVRDPPYSQTCTDFVSLPFDLIVRLDPDLEKHIAHRI